MFQCSFELNNQPISTFKLGALSFPAFSGYGEKVNNRSTVCLAGEGAIPPGTYYILDRESGGRLGALWDRIKGRTNWFALYADDGRIDDYMLCDEVERGNFRLHPKGVRGISKGCITIESDAHYLQIYTTLKSASPILIPGSQRRAYGKVVVR